MDNIEKQKINTKLLQENIDDNLLNGSIEITLLNNLCKNLSPKLLTIKTKKVKIESKKKEREKK